MDGTGIEPVTFSVSGRRATAAPTVRAGGILSRQSAFVKSLFHEGVSRPQNVGVKKPTAEKSLRDKEIQVSSVVAERLLGGTPSDAHVLWAEERSVPRQKCAFGVMHSEHNVLVAEEHTDHIEAQGDVFV